MQRIIPSALVGAALAFAITFAIAPASSQQLQQPTTLTPAPVVHGVGPQLHNPQDNKPPAIPSTPEQRPQSSSPIADQGPAKQLPKTPANSQTDPVQPIRPNRVLDATGKPVSGTIPVAPNRVYDPATGRYYWTTPSGQPVR